MRSRRTIAIIALLALTTVFVGGACRKSDGAESNANKQPQIVDVTAVPAVVQPIPTFYEATGSLASDEQTDVAPAVSGKITQVKIGRAHV